MTTHKWYYDKSLSKHKIIVETYLVNGLEKNYMSVNG